MSIFSTKGTPTMGEEAQRAAGVRFQKSAYGVPVPLLWGRQRCAPNILWYNNFKATAHTVSQPAGGKGFGGGSGAITNTTYTYSAGFILGLPEGALDSVPRAWRNKSLLVNKTVRTITEAEETLTINGSARATVSHAADFHRDRGVHRPLPTLRNDDGDSYRKLLNHEYTVEDGVYQFDASMIGFKVTIFYSWISAEDVVPPLEQLGLTLFRGVGNQNPWSFITASYPGQALAYRGHAYVAGSDVQLGSDPVAPNFTFECQSENAFGGPNNVTGVALDVALTDALTNADYGSGFPLSKFGDLTQFHNFACAAGYFANLEWAEQRPAAELVQTLCKMGLSEPFFSEGFLKVVPYGDSAITGNGVSYTPATTPLFTLTSDDILPYGGDDDPADPIRINRKAPSDAYNVVQVEYLNKAKDYNVSIAEAKDQAAIDAFGVRSAPIIQAHGITDAASARSLAQQYLNRFQFICNEYSFRVSWRYSMLEQMDIIAIPDPTLPGNTVAVRILELGEDEHGTITMERAEEFRDGVSTDAVYDTQTDDGYTNDPNADPGDVNTPVLVDAPVELCNSGGPEVWAAVSGLSPDWGGADIYVSMDGDSYSFIGRTMTKARTGRTLTDLSDAKDPDTASTLRVDLTESDGGIGSVSQASVNKAITTLFWLDGEFMAYRDRTLVSANVYDLDYLRRGLYNSPRGAHKSRARFARLDNRVFKWPYTFDMLGRLIRLKFCSFNIYGGAPQAIDRVPAFDYRLKGPFATISNPVTGLEIFGQGNLDTFSGKECKFSWRENTTGSFYNLGSESYGAGSGQVDPFFAHFEVRIYKAADGSQLRVEKVLDPLYIYTHEKNAEDHKGTPQRAFTIRVWQVNRFGGKSPMPAMLKVSNPAPAVSGVTLTPIPGGFQYLFETPTDLDFSGVKIHASLTSGFTPGADTIRKNAPFTNAQANTGQITGLYSGMTYYVRFIPYDVFGDGPASAEFEVNTQLFSNDGDISNEHRLGFMTVLQRAVLQDVFGFASSPICSNPCYVPITHQVVIGAVNPADNHLWLATLSLDDLVVVKRVDTGILIDENDAFLTHNVIYSRKTKFVYFAWFDGSADISYLLEVNPRTLQVVRSDFTLAGDYAELFAQDPRSGRILVAVRVNGPVRLREYDVLTGDWVGGSYDLPALTDSTYRQCCLAPTPTGLKWVVSSNGSDGDTYFIPIGLGSHTAYSHSGSAGSRNGTIYSPLDDRIWVVVNGGSVSDVDILTTAGVLDERLTDPAGVDLFGACFCPLNNLIFYSAVDGINNSVFVSMSPITHEVVGKTGDGFFLVDGLTWVSSASKMVGIHMDGVTTFLV